MGRPTLDGHPKFRRLVLALGGDRALARGCLELLWDMCYQSGDARIGSPDDVEHFAGWTRRGRAPGRLFEALRDAGGPGRSGFIARHEAAESCWKVHDLLDHAPEYVHRRLKRETERHRNHEEIRPPPEASCPVTDRSVTTPPAPTPAPAPKKKVPGSAKDADPAQPDMLPETQGKRTDPRHAPVVKAICEVYQDVRCVKYGFRGRDALMVTDLLALAGPGPNAGLEVIARWTRALRHAGYPTVSSLAELKEHWNTFGGTGPPVKQGALLRADQQHKSDDPRIDEWLKSAGD